MTFDGNYGRHHFGKDGEHYVKELLQVLKVHTGSNFPDLLTCTKYSDPPLAFEVKTGGNKSVVLCEYQLHYGHNPHIPKKLRHLLTTPPSTYYIVLDRTSYPEEAQLDQPYGSIHIDWGNQYYIPADLAFATFATAKALKTTKDPSEIMKELHGLREKQIERSIVGWKQPYDRNRWQNIRMSDLDALFTGETNLQNGTGTRVAALRSIYPEELELKRISLAGPNNTMLYIFAKPEDVHMFDKSIRNMLECTAPTLDRVHRERTHAREKILSCAAPLQQDLFSEAITDPNLRALSNDEKKYLHRLQLWRLPSDDLLARIHKR